MAVRLEEPIELSLPDQDRPLQFKTLEQLHDWAEPEVAAWEKFEAAMSGLDGAVRGNFNQQVHHLRQVLANTKAAIKRAPNDPELNALIATIRSELTQYRNHSPLRASSPEGQHVLQLAESDPLLAFMMLAAWNPRVFDVRNHLKRTIGGQDSQWLIAWVQGIAAARLFDQGIRGNARAEKAALARLRSEWEAELNSFQNWKHDSEHSTSAQLGALQSDRERYQHLMAMMLRKGRRTLARVKSRYQSELALQIPVTYWTAKAGDHQSAARLWGALFVASVLGVLGAGIRFRSEIGEFVAPIGAGAQVPFGRVALLTVAFFLVVWLLRVISRLLVTNLNMMHDARERAVMTKTFLALMDEQGHVDNNDRILILHSLFRPSGAAGGADDTTPPHWFDLLLDRLKRVG